MLDIFTQKVAESRLQKLRNSRTMSMFYYEDVGRFCENRATAYLAMAPSRRNFRPTLTDTNQPIRIDNDIPITPQYCKKKRFCQHLGLILAKYGHFAQIHEFSIKISPQADEPRRVNAMGPRESIQSRSKVRPSAMRPYIGPDRCRARAELRPHRCLD